MSPSLLTLRLALVALLFASLLGTAFAAPPFASLLLRNTYLNNNNNNNSSILNNNASRPVSLASGHLSGCSNNGPCAAKGDKCSSDATQYRTFSCDSSPNKELCCGLGLWCLSGTCVTDNLGKSCNSPLDCRTTWDGTNVVGCVNSTCTELYFTGDSCSSNSDCISGVCQNSLCQGTPVGSPCPTGYQTCVQNAFCNQLNVCQAAASKGALCAAGITPCQSGLVCSDNVCRELFSLEAGQSCDVNFQCDDDLACVSGTCVPGIEETTDECSEDSDCKENSCSCSTTSGKGYCDYGQSSINCFSELEDLSDCLDDNNCLYSLDVFSRLNPILYSPYADVGPNNAPNSCTRKNCRARYAAVAICECVRAKAALGNCYNEYYCSKIALWLILVLVAAGVVALCLVCICVVICCRVCRRRKSYAHV